MPAEADEAAHERPERQAHQPGAEHRSVGAALVALRHDLADGGVVGDVDHAGADPLHRAEEHSRDRGPDEGERRAGGAVGQKAANLNGPAADPVRQATDRVLHEHRREEECRHGDADEGDRRPVLAEVERQQRQHAAGAGPFDERRDRQRDDDPLRALDPARRDRGDAHAHVAFFSRRVRPLR